MHNYASKNICDKFRSKKQQKQKVKKTKKYIRNLQNNKKHKKLNLLTQFFKVELSGIIQGIFVPKISFLSSLLYELE